jgi:hypothetical protein
MIALALFNFLGAFIIGCGLVDCLNKGLRVSAAVSGTIALGLIIGGIKLWGL